MFDYGWDSVLFSQPTLIIQLVEKQSTQNVMEQMLVQLCCAHLTTKQQKDISCKIVSVELYLQASPSGKLVLYI